MGVGLAGALADHHPGEHVAEVGGEDRVESLGAGRQLHPDEVVQELARGLEAVLDAEVAVEVRVGEEAAPVRGAARLLEVDAHHDEERLGELVREGGEALRVVVGADDVVDRARADDREQPRVGAVEDLADRLAEPRHELLLLRQQRVEALQVGRREERVDGADEVVGVERGGHGNFALAGR